MSATKKTIKPNMDDTKAALQNLLIQGKKDGMVRTTELNALLEKLGVEAASGTHEISLCYATAAQARQLDVNPGDALLQLVQVIFDQHGAPLHTSHQVIRGDRFTFRI